MEKKILDLIDDSVDMGYDLDGDMINGEYRHVINEARQEEMSISDVLKHIDQKGRNK